MPLAIALLGDTGLARIQQVEGGRDRIAHRALGLEVDLVSGLPGLFDGALKIGHGCPLVLVGLAFAKKASPVKTGF